MTTFCRLRQRACSRAGECARSVGWMASNSFGSLSGPLFRHAAAEARIDGRPALHVHHPAGVLRARPGEHVSAGELDGLGADRAEDPVRQPDRRRPGPPLVGGGAREAPPLARAGTDLVEEEEGAARRLEEHGVPAGVARAVGLAAGRDLDRRGPAAFASSRHPDADVRVPLLRAPEPRGEEAVPRLHDRRRVGRRKRRPLEHEAGRDDRGRPLGCGDRRCRHQKRGGGHRALVQTHSSETVRPACGPSMRAWRAPCASSQ